jgi:general stress protein 26
MTTIDRGDFAARLKTIFGRERLAVLTTQAQDGQLHSTVMCFLSADNLHSMVFATPRKTRKFENLTANQNPVMFIDSRNREQWHIDEVYGIEVRGPASLLEEPGIYRDLYLHKFPELGTFAESTDTAWFRMTVKSYDVVHRFQEVVQLFPPDFR